MSSTKIVLAFDVYGTLFDTSSVINTVRKFVQDDQTANSVVSSWRTFQLEYTWRLVNSMGLYESFDEVTRKALINAFGAQGIKLENPQIEELMASYTDLT
ncbi:hypothetical protein SISSUDRAFT_573214 [Sistotremastrum suecicum HHB10207 ss-3]|uniref:HAD-like protein n=1 Tax=Sistotremastrum suecicum HHB10207 ss-3 TaxID=1314776 RepID=A0A166ESF4_9AGAM|nr:hypothetical protein SISSUDRAFT_573214 [Sistotremastrum suecicum HHB10207 ss-3]